jgi:hypothetical protein
MPRTTIKGDDANTEEEEALETPKPLPGKHLLLRPLLIGVTLICIASILSFILGNQAHMILGSKQTLKVSFCNDTDGDDISARGTVTYRDLVDDYSISSLDDLCDYYSTKADFGVGLVREGRCENGMLQYYLSTCGKGSVCRNGACVQGGPELPVCSDSDNGKDPAVRGDIYGYGGSGTDSCWVTDRSAAEVQKDTHNAQGSLAQECTGQGCYVWEYFCQNEGREFELIPCLRCEDGECLG